MNLNHMNLCVSDVAATQDFFINLFELEVIGTAGNHAMAVLQDQSRFSLVLMQLRNDEPVVYPGSFHVGFIVEDIATVLTVRERAIEAGIDAGKIMNARRGTMFYCTGPDRLLVEVCSNHSAES